jgi:hypothetical protein
MRSDDKIVHFMGVTGQDGTDPVGMLLNKGNSGPEDGRGRALRPPRDGIERRRHDHLQGRRMYRA